MFVRFRLQGNRLQASLVQRRRAAGKVQAEHVGTLGSVDAGVSVRERIAFWAKLPRRLAALDNRLSTDEHPAIIAALHARIPMVTVEDLRAVQEESFKDEERFWDTIHDLNASHVEGHKEQIALAEAKIAEMAPEVAKAAEKVEVARNKREKLKRGEVVSGGLGKRVDLRAIIKAAGITPSLLRRIRLFGRLTPTEFEALHALEPMHQRIEAGDRLVERETRRIIRARTSRPFGD
jgi:hypothetical protein